jgi:hypothetical protein
MKKNGKMRKKILPHFLTVIKNQKQNVAENSIIFINRNFTIILK